MVAVAVEDIVVEHVPSAVTVESEPPQTLAELLAWDAPIAGRLTSAFGHRDLGDSLPASTFHDAVDVAAPMGTPVTAPVKLRIRTIAYQARAGRYVIADVVNADGAVECADFCRVGGGVGGVGRGVRGLPAPWKHRGRDRTGLSEPL